MLSPTASIVGNRNAALANELAEATGMSLSEVNQRLEKITADMDSGRTIDWKLVSPLLRRPLNNPPYSDHGTHVAGVLRRTGELEYPR